MKFTCEKFLLLNAINISSRAASPKSVVPALEGLLIEAAGDIKVSGYDLKTGIRTSFPADIEEAGSIVLNSRLFGDIVRKLPEDVISVSVDKNLMTTIECGMSKFNIIGIDSSDYPELPAVESQNVVEIKQSVLKSMISQTNFAVSDNETRPIHTGSLFEVGGDVLTIVSVDGYRLALRREEIEKKQVDKYSFVVPGAALAEVEKILRDSDDNVKIILGNKHITFAIDETVLISRRLEGEFLNYKQAVPMDGQFSVMADRKALATCIERVSLIVSDRLKSPVRCRFENNLFKVTTATALGKAYDECEVEGDCEGLEIGFNNKYLLDALRAAPAEKVLIKLSSPVSPCVILPADESTNFVYMILPVRIRANEN